MVPAGTPPLAVPATAGKVDNLVAAKADEATKALKADEATKALKADEATHAANADNAANADKLDGKVSTDFTPKTYLRTAPPVTVPAGGPNTYTTYTVNCDNEDIALSGGWSLTATTLQVMGSDNVGLPRNQWRIKISAESPGEAMLSVTCADYEAP